MLLAKTNRNLRTGHNDTETLDKYKHAATVVTINL